MKRISFDVEDALYEQLVDAVKRDDFLAGEDLTDEERAKRKPLYLTIDYVSGSNKAFHSHRISAEASREIQEIAERSDGEAAAARLGTRVTVETVPDGAA